jgi:hypothetical protein
MRYVNAVESLKNIGRVESVRKPRGFCPDCGGKGYSKVERGYESGCKTCYGTGKLIAKVCPSCKKGFERVALDSNGVKCSLSGRPEVYQHACEDSYWKCKKGKTNPQDEIKFLKECIDASIKDTKYFESELKAAKSLLNEAREVLKNLDAHIDFSDPLDDKEKISPESKSEPCANSSWMQQKKAEANPEPTVVTGKDGGFEWSNTKERELRDILVNHSTSTKAYEYQNLIQDLLEWGNKGVDKEKELRQIIENHTHHTHNQTSKENFFQDLLEWRKS